MTPESAAAHTIRSQSTSMSRGLVLLMAVSCGMIVANLYYNQPLLADIGRTFSADAEQMGIIAMLTQIGYAAGIFLFVPLGDIRDKRRLITVLQYSVGFALIGTATAQTLLWMYIASFAVGFTAVATQLIVPFGTMLAHPAERGKVVGTLISGLLIGIVMARITSGFIGELFGWRAMFGLAAVMMFGLGYLLNRRLPTRLPDVRLSYPGLIRSMGKLFAGQKTLREASLIGACLFGSYSVFWTALPFFLEGPHYRMGSSVAGLFGLVGLAGAAAAPVIGRLSDRISARIIAGFMIGIGMLAYLCLLLAGHSMSGLVLGAILMDFGIQAAQVSNQTRIYGMMPEARSRLNTVLMVTTFAGGSIGASLGGYAWSRWGWHGTCYVGGGMIVTAFLIWAVHRMADTKKPAVNPN